MEVSVTSSTLLPDRTRVAIIGSGFAGLAMAIRLKQAGEHNFVVLERADDVGGTWRDNTYPGCACDVPSNLYSFSFAPNPYWSRAFSPQAEIHEYLRETARRFGVLPHIAFGADVESAHWVDDDQEWIVETSAGTVQTRILVSGAGPLSEPSYPDIPGLEDFAGKRFHSADWDHGHDLTGERVAVIGTGASAVQFVPHVQSRARHLTIFQRTPPWVLPRPDRPVPGLLQRAYAAAPAMQKAVRAGVYWRQEAMLPGLVHKPELLKGVEKLARAHMKWSVKDPALRAKLTPDYRIGCKRILIANGYYPSLAKPNVDVVTDQIARVGVDSITTADGTERPIDTLIFGTGFHVTDSAISDRVRGRHGETLAERWKGSPQAYLGASVSGFPNLFLLVGPNTGPGHTSVVFYIESQVAYVLDALRTMDSLGATSLDVRRDVEDSFNDDVQRRMRGTVWTTGGCGSWYLDESGRNTTLWPGFSFQLRWRTRKFDLGSYDVGRRTPLPATA
ncbi:cyclohexanone monooxygenase [Nocardioides sp. CF8]|uniref:flavin-containing monooxygenase n=1 Tax=Nocardioides sp. CF8 TaxID=110319 RepID=UPI000330112C|nr:NAD(P)/FAD-dependent oxidoreductase [Nocardioides sp. CF8]EON24163.1 cyclohexanone monooxygenase [Nocardioides sp. CF8]